MDGDPVEAIRRTHLWFERNSGWSPPDAETIDEWLADGVCRCPDDCWATPTTLCEHGLAAWWLVLRTLDCPHGGDLLEPARLVPHPDRMDPSDPNYVCVLDAHHRALCDGQAGYSDRLSGLFVQTARTLWERGSCCEQGCRHCPFVDRAGHTD